MKMSEINTDTQSGSENKSKPITFRGRPLNNKIIRGPIKGLIHGINGSRKTTFFSQMPNPCLADVDGNAEQVPDKRFVPDGAIFDKHRITTFSDLMSLVDDLINDPHTFKSFGIDTLTNLNT